MRRATQQTIEVEATAGVVQTENANQSTSYSTRQMANLPVNGRGITNANGLPFKFGAVHDERRGHHGAVNNNKSGASNNTLGANEIAEAAVVPNAERQRHVGVIRTDHEHGQFAYDHLRHGAGLDRLGPSSGAAAREIHLPGLAIAFGHELPDCWTVTPCRGGR